MRQKGFNQDIFMGNFIPVLKGITTEDIAQMKYNEAQAYGFTTDEYGTLKTYLKTRRMPVVIVQENENLIGLLCLGFFMPLFGFLFSFFYQTTPKRSHFSRLYNFHITIWNRVFSNIAADNGY
jgi:hypothetical protein